MDTCLMQQSVYGSTGMQQHNCVKLPASVTAAAAGSCGCVSYHSAIKRSLHRPVKPRPGAEYITSKSTGVGLEEISVVG
jgi:hypothetical protein